MTTKAPVLRLTNCSHLLTGDGPLRGPLTSWQQLGLRRDWELVVGPTTDNWTIQWMGPAGSADMPSCDATVDLGGGLLLPGLIDCHTHAVFAGDRSGEFSRRMAGASYADIAAEGGGILTTMRQSRAATIEQLLEGSAARVEQMLAHGVRVLEIKTGYGLSAASEVKLLKVIAALGERYRGQLLVVPTAMPAHAVPPEHAGDPDRYLDLICDEILPQMAASTAPCTFVDVFIEQGYFDVCAAQRIAQVANRFGWRIKAHVDEFADIGGLQWAVQAQAVSVEHLLTTSADSITALAASDTVAVCLPLTSLFLREGYAPMRALVDGGAMVAVATDCNPGSAMTTNLPLAMQVAMLNGRLSPMECLRGVTSVAARAVGCPTGYDGVLRVGGPLIASLFQACHPDELFYELGAPPRAVPLDLAAAAAAVTHA